jgi:putative SOS response-associated peptidase YedK
MEARRPTEPNVKVGTVHPKETPVFLTEPAEWATWLTAEAPEALKLQGPLPDGALKIVARGAKEDDLAP